MIYKNKKLNLKNDASNTIKMFQFHAKYKNKSFEEISELVKNDKKIMQNLIRTLNHPSTSQDKKNEIQQFIDYYNQPVLQNQEENIANMIELRIDIPKVERIFHISDIHIRLYNRQKEYQDVFQKLYDYIKQNSSNKEIIIITGDLLHSKNNLSPESILITQHFLINLANLCPTFLIAGNHDAMLTNQQREDSITAIVQNIHIPNFFYLRNSGVYLAANVAISVCSILDNQWIHANSFQPPPKIQHKIALYHGGVGIVDTGVGHRLRGEKLVSDFDGYDFTLLGDIHKYQWLIPKRMAYASSLIAQNFSEFQDPHGVLVWNLETLEHIYHPIDNPCGFFVLNMTNNQLFVNDAQIAKDDIPNYLQNITASLQIKLNIQNCSHDFITEIKQKIQAVSNDAKIIPNYLAANPSSRRQEDPITYDDSSLQQLLVQHIQKIRPNIATDELQFITQKYQEYASNAAIMNERNMARWELIDIKFSNLFGYGPNNFIDFQRFSEKSTIGIIAPNSYGKSSLIDIILFALFSKFSRTRGTSVSKDIININATNFSVRLRFKIGGDIYTIQKEGKREQSDKIKITQNQLLKQSTDSEEVINMTDENRLKTDKIIGELIGSYDDMTFTNIQLQNRNQSFKDMTDKDRKDYLYKILKLDVWNHMVDAIKNDMKPMKAHITYLEKTIENINIEQARENMAALRLKMQDQRDAYEQQLYEKELNLEKIGGNIIHLSSAEIAQSKSQFAAIGRKLATLGLIPNSQKIKKLFTENESKFLEKLEKLEEEKNSHKLIGFFSPGAKLRSVDTIKPELDAAKIDLKEAQMKYKFVDNDAPILTPDMIKKNDRIMEVIREKIATMEMDLKKYNEENIKKFLQNEPHYRKLFIQRNIRESIVTIITGLGSHEYDPNCKFCVANPIVQGKAKKERELEEINTKIAEIEKLITFQIEENEFEIYVKQNEELKNLRETLQIKRDKLEKMENEKESYYGRSIIHRLESQINGLQIEYVHSEQNFQINEKNKEIQAEIDRITEEIKALKGARDSSMWYKDYHELVTQEKIYGELHPQYETLEVCITNYEKTRGIREKIERNDRVIADTTIQMGKIQQQIVQAREEIQKFEQISSELLEKMKEYGMMKSLEESLNKDGLPLQILKNYLVPITEEINGIIRPFISRKICLRVEDDELILDSFPNEGADKSVFMHGGMESFILDIAFKITLSNFAKLPKCNILFLDEGISAFDGERLANIDILFSFIQNYFPKTVLITHLDSVKENIQEKIMISKENNLSKIECFFLR
jgi:DNA repair exonuclease SbcCD ATPase subunit/DNA repair exonuclease SbcCD nuclease subunit